ncbi:hypothetical protein [Lacinutrix salivirga]
MAQNISLIITKEKINLDKQVHHFNENGFLIIPVNEDSFNSIESHAKKFKSFQEIFDNEVVGFFKDANESDYNDIEDYEGLILVELIARLKLKDFLLYHLSEVYLTGVFTNAINFKNGKVYGNGYEEFEKTGIDINNYWKYYSCKEKYNNPNSYKERQTNIKSFSQKKWFKFWK